MKKNSSCRILIVEDCDDQANLLRLLLDRDDYEIDVAADGVDALEKLKTFKPSLVITDLLMPRMDGFELCAALKNDSSLGDIPVLVLTTQGEIKDVLNALQAGANFYFTKPFDRQFLRDWVFLFCSQVRSREFPADEIEKFQFITGSQTLSVNRRHALEFLLNNFKRLNLKKASCFKVLSEMTRNGNPRP